jgi:hypothetical protein
MFEIFDHGGPQALSMFRHVARYLQVLAAFDQRLNDRSGLLVNRVQSVPDLLGDEDCHPRLAVLDSLVDVALYLFGTCHVRSTQRLWPCSPYGRLSEAVNLRAPSPSSAASASTAGAVTAARAVVLLASLCRCVGALSIAITADPTFAFCRSTAWPTAWARRRQSPVPPAPDSRHRERNRAHHGPGQENERQRQGTAQPPPPDLEDICERFWNLSSGRGSATRARVPRRRQFKRHTWSARLRLGSAVCARLSTPEPARAASRFHSRAKASMSPIWIFRRGWSIPHASWPRKLAFWTECVLSGSSGRPDTTRGWNVRSRDLLRCADPLHVCGPVRTIAECTRVAAQALVIRMPNWSPEDLRRPSVQVGHEPPR